MLWSWTVAAAASSKWPWQAIFKASGAFYDLALVWAGYFSQAGCHILMHPEQEAPLSCATPRNSVFLSYGYICTVLTVALALRIALNQGLYSRADSSLSTLSRWIIQVVCRLVGWPWIQRVDGVQTVWCLLSPLLDSAGIMCSSVGQQENAPKPSPAQVQALTLLAGLKKGKI